MHTGNRPMDVLDSSLAADHLVAHFVGDLELSYAGRSSATMFHALYRLEVAIDHLSLHICSLNSTQLIGCLRMSFGQADNLQWTQSKLVDEGMLLCMALILIEVLYLIALPILLLQQKLRTTNRMIIVNGLKAVILRLRIRCRLLLL